MRSIRLASFVIAAAAMSACSNDLTAPARSVPSAPSLDASCRSGYLLSSGRCVPSAPELGQPASTGTTVPTKPVITGTTGPATGPFTGPATALCTGFLLSTGRCE